MNLALASMIASRESQNIKAQLRFFYIIYTNYNIKSLAKVKKPKILLNKFNGLNLRRNFKIAQKEKKDKNGVLVYIYFETRELVVIWIINLKIYLKNWVEIFIGNQSRYKYKLNRHKTEILCKSW